MAQFFYVFDEHTDVDMECKKRGMIPCLGSSDSEYILGNTKYITLSPHECYSGWTVVLMVKENLGYEKLLKLLETTTVYDEIVGCIGILLKENMEEFTYYLTTTKTKRTQKIKKIILKDIVDNSEYVSKMKRLIEVCRN